MDDLSHIVDRYLDETGYAPSSFGRDVMNNPNFVSDLRAGNGWTHKTYRRVLSFMADNPTRQERRA